MKRIRLLFICLLGLAAGLTAAQALADSARVKDERGETRALERNGRLDIVKAGVTHRGGTIKHVVTMRKKVRPAKKKERPLIGINTRGGQTSDPEFLVLGESVFRIRKGRKPRAVAEARLSSRKRRWIYRIDVADLDFDRYGWVALTKKGKAFDAAPGDRYKLHVLSAA